MFENSWRVKNMFIDINKGKIAESPIIIGPVGPFVGPFFKNLGNIGLIGVAPPPPRPPPPYIEGGLYS